MWHTYRRGSPVNSLNQSDTLHCRVVDKQLRFRRWQVCVSRIFLTWWPWGWLSVDFLTTPIVEVNDAGWKTLALHTSLNQTLPAGQLTNFTWSERRKRNILGQPPWSVWMSDAHECVFVKIVQQHLCEVDIQLTSSGRIGVLALLRSLLRGRGCVRLLRGVGEAGVGW